MYIIHMTKTHVCIHTDMCVRMPLKDTCTHSCMHTYTCRTGRPPLIWRNSRRSHQRQRQFCCWRRHKRPVPSTCRGRCILQFGVGGRARWRSCCRSAPMPDSKTGYSREHVHVQRVCVTCCSCVSLFIMHIIQTCYACMYM
jgi:hypothetical protein